MFVSGLYWGPQHSPRETDKYHGTPWLSRRQLKSLVDVELGTS